MTKFDADDKKGGLVDIEKALAMGHDVSKSQLDMLRLVAVYLKFEDFAKVAIYYEKLIKLAPKNAQYRASLAVAYQKIGRIDDAVVEAKNAATLDPLYEAEARKFVNSLGREW
jgi:tetratricopeptide (TPR) repeat protein